MATAGGDKKLRIWDRDSGAQVAEAAVGTNLQDMQVGITWPSASKVISVALDGRLICWEVGSGLSMEGIVDGTQGPLNCLASDSMTGNLIYGGTQGAAGAFWCSFSIPFAPRLHSWEFCIMQRSHISTPILDPETWLSRCSKLFFCPTSIVK